MYRLLIGMAAFLLLGDATYTKSIQEWQDHREKGLRAPDSWLSLVGLFWLKPGVNSIGSAQSNSLVLRRDSVPAHWGDLRLSGDQVSFIRPDGSSLPLQAAAEEKDSQMIRSGSVSFYLIKRLDKLGIRVKDSNSPVLVHFKGTTFFPVSPELHVQGRLVSDAKKISILNVLGQTEMQDSPGIVQFSFEGKPYSLRPIYEGKTLFFLFRDSTNKINTYQAGRMLNTPLPVDGKVDLDFNRSYNPPCTFTPYATCPLAPKENTLPFSVKAGEMRYGSGHADYEVGT